MGNLDRNITIRRKLAYILANGDYDRNENKLGNCINNAKKLSAILEKINFQEVIMHKNIEREDKIMENIQKFEAKIKTHDLVLFYFAGHAVSVENENYLIPTKDSKIDNDSIKDYGLSVTQILKRLHANGPSCVIMILDCCRPYVLTGESAGTTMKIENGLCRMNIGRSSGTFIQYSCAANEIDERDIFIKHLLENIGRENVAVPTLFRDISDKVCLEKYNNYRPLSMNGLSEDDPIYFNLDENRNQRTKSNPALFNRRKLALIIANEDYQRVDNKLTDCVENAKNLKDVLTRIGFKVTLRSNLNDETTIMRAVQDFESNITDNELVLVYFTGHGYCVNDKNYLLPVDDTRIDDDDDVETFGVNAERILTRLRDKSRSCAIILILDCCRRYRIPQPSPRSPRQIESGLCAMNTATLNGTFVQFSCAAEEISDDDLFVDNLLLNIARKNMSVPEVFQDIADQVCLERSKEHQPLSINGLLGYKDIYLNQVLSILPDIPYNARWKSDARTVAGSHDHGNALDTLHRPNGLWIGKNDTMLIADSLNHRIMKYNFRTENINIQRIAGRNIQGYRPHLLAEPSNVVFHPASKSYIICDYHNRRVLQLPRKLDTHPKAIIKDIACFGVAVDIKGLIYVSDTERHEVVRFRLGKKHPKVVAGGNGQGHRLHQFNHPTYICIGDNQSLYISDSWNDRVVKWDKGAKRGVVVAGGKGKGKDRNQLNYPTGILVDRLGTVYIADHSNHRIMRWRKDAERGDRIAGDPYLGGDDSHQLNGPEGIAFDSDGNLYVADSNNHRIQRFKIKKT